MSKAKKGLIRKFLNHYIIKSVIILISLVIIAVISAFVFLRVYTHHGEAIPVPDIVGLSFEQAQQVLNQNKMRLARIDSVFAKEFAPGAVVSQKPEAGFKVKENRNIFVITNAYSVELVEVPNVMEMPVQQARNRLTKAGLNIGKIIYVWDRAVDNVLKQSFEGKAFKKGEKIPKGSAVDLEVAKGISDTKSPVPALLGKNLKEATITSSLSSFWIGIINYDETILNATDSTSAKIWRQSPNSGSELRLGEEIEIWLTTANDKITSQTSPEI